MEESHFEHQHETEQNAYQMVREEPLKRVETFDNKSITKLGKASKKKKWIPITIGIVISVFFLVLVFCFLKFYPKYALIKSLDMWTNSLEIMEKPSYSSQYNWDEMTTKGTATMKFGDFLLSNLDETDAETSAILKQLNTLSFQIETRISKKDHKSFVDLNGQIENEKFLNLSYINYDQKQYILLKEVLETYLQLEENDEVISTQTDTETFYEDIKYVWVVLKKSLKKNIKSSYIKKEPEKITINGKIVRTTKISLVIDEKANYELSKNIIEDLKADKKAYDILVNLYPKFANYEEIKFESSSQVSYSVNVVKGIPKIIKASLKVNEEEVLSLIKSDDYVLEFEENGEPLFRIILKEESNGFKMKFQFVENNLEMILIGKREKNSTIYNFSIEMDGSILEVVSTRTLKEMNNDTIKENLELEFKVAAGGFSLDVMNMNLDLETTKGAIFEEIKNSKFITDLTEEEKQKIQTYFENFGELLNVSEQF